MSAKSPMALGTNPIFRYKQYLTSTKYFHFTPGRIELSILRKVVPHEHGAHGKLAITRFAFFFFGRRTQSHELLGNQGDTALEFRNGLTGLDGTSFGGQVTARDKGGEFVDGFGQFGQILAQIIVGVSGAITFVAI